MHPKNREKFDFAGILAWHEAGYTGRGVTVATLERETSSISPDDRRHPTG